MTRFITHAMSYIPRNLPVGLAEFYTWSDRIISLSGPFADPDSMRFALASQLIHLGAQTSKVPDQYFVRSLRKAASNQVASQVFQDVKNKQIEAAKVAELERLAQLNKVEATTPQVNDQAVASDEQQQQKS